MNGIGGPINDECGDGPANYGARVATRPWLMLVTGRELISSADPAGSEDRLLGILAAAAAGGVDLVQLREKDLDPGRLASLARRVRSAIPGSVRLIVNGSFETATAGHADGVHYPESAAVGEAKIFRSKVANRLSGRSIHSLLAAIRAADEGMDYLIAGSIYETSSHPGAASQGIDFLRRVCQAVPIPVLAIGGITPQRAPECLSAGAIGVAVRSPILTAGDPEHAAREYRRALDAEL
ncbi:MAG TPA: thiamine phosphate synthase [Armatimonadota bacterium]|nr:thiamine phosphate synthase [Armatimonadota bacterium]